jgi:hypothetical protein
MLSPFKLKLIGVGFLNLVVCMGLSTLALSAERKVVPEVVPDVEQPGRTIHGKVVKVKELDASKHKWEVSVENIATGDVVTLHLDKTTERQDKDPDPALGDIVITKYDENSKHALTFVREANLKSLEDNQQSQKSLTGGKSEKP